MSRPSIGHLNQTGIALVVGLVGTFIGALGVANSLQNALNSAWEIPFARRPGFPWSWLRSAALIIVVGTGFIATTVSAPSRSASAASCPAPARPYWPSRCRWC